MEFPLEAAIQAASERPRVLFICNPNNPTGTQIQPAAIESILKQATHTAVVIDEAYAEFAPEVSVVKLIHEYPQLFVARTFSKVAGLASLRLGAVIAHRDSLTMLRRATAPFPVNLAALVAAVAAVNDRKTMTGYLRNIARTRAWFEKTTAHARRRNVPEPVQFLADTFRSTTDQRCSNASRATASCSAIAPKTSARASHAFRSARNPKWSA